MSVSQDVLTQAILSPEAATPKGLSDGRGQSAGKRFDVYRNNVAVSLTEALVTAFPTIHSLVGDKFFRAMAGVYLRKYPPTSPLMMFYGEDMPGFLANFEPAQSLPYLPDAARVDLALRRAYHAADAQKMPPGALELAPEDIITARFEVAPSVHVIESEFPIHGIWSLARGGPKTPVEPQDVLISRPDFDPMVDLLPKGAATFLLALKDGATTGDALDTSSLDPASGLGPTLTLALERGIFTRRY